METSQQLLNNRYRIRANAGADRGGYFLSLEETGTEKRYYTKLIKIDDNAIGAQALYALQLRVQALSRFSHTNVIQLCEPELAPEGLLIRQSELPGESLKRLLQKKGRPLPLKKAFRIALDIASVLASLHHEGLAHGELDPSHIWLDDQGKTYLSFLELPPAFDSDRLIYQLPELVPSSGPGTEADIYAFGILLLELSTGISLFRPSGDRTDLEEYSRIFTYYRECIEKSVGLEAPDFVPILSRCLTDNKTRRFKDGEELYWAIRALIEKSLPPQDELVNEKKPPAPLQQQAAVQKAAPTFETEKPKKKKASWVPLLLSGLLFLGAAAYLWFSKPDWFPLNGREAEPEESPSYAETLDVLYITQTVMEAESRQQAAAEVPTETAVPTETPLPEPTATPLPQPIEAAAGSNIVWKADGSRMAAVPGTTFTMGMDHTFVWEMDGILPAHLVQLDSFWMDQAEVTQAQYARCVGEGVCRPIERIPEQWIGDSLPILNVTWSDAVTYCAWAGKRLPSEAEWELAARGTDRRLYPWGNFSPEVSSYPTQLHAGGADSRDLSPYGIWDMGGNVSEWTNDFFSETRLITGDTLVNPIGPISGNTHTVKGGSFSSADPEAENFVFNRRGASPDSTQQIGFRCVVSNAGVDTSKADIGTEKLPLAPAVTGTDRPADCTDLAKFVEDVTIPDNSAVTRGETITKTWKLENYGTCPWNENYKIVWVDENYSNPQRMFDIGTALQPGEQGDISVTFDVQGTDKTHISFKLANTRGETFGLGPQARGDLYIQYNVN